MKTAAVDFVVLVVVMILGWILGRFLRDGLATVGVPIAAGGPTSQNPNRAAILGGGV